MQNRALAFAALHINNYYKNSKTNKKQKQDEFVRLTL